ncbi:hypothetical protein [Streptomyces sp. NPDC002994]|uniref:hypothetical protein n=1 Tax=Streptomyces sp. NPDC002994 TaxID=3154441 RepID=UPI0033BA1389
MSSKQERHGPDGPLNDLTGKATVNDGPNDERDELGKGDDPGTKPDIEPDAEAGIEREAEAATEPEAEAATEPEAEAATEPDAEPATEPEATPVIDLGIDDVDAGGVGSDELALRRMLRGAVEELEPSQDALDHLRRAVPARRARRRHTIVGMAAAALFVSTAVPAFVHVANSSDAADANPSIAGHGQEAHGGTGWEKGAKDGKKDADKPSGKSTSKRDKEKQKDKKKGPGKGSPGTSRDRGTGGGGTGTSDSVPASAPTCGASQLSAYSEGTSADAEGKVYGSFRVSNISEMACVVAGSGAVTFQAMGAADPARINVVDHTSGDAAAGLPDPSMETTGLLLEPDMSYQVKFAWVPTETCPTTSEPSPDPTQPTEPPGTGTTDGGTGGADGGAGGGAGGNGGEMQPGTEPQLGTEDGGTADGSVSVSLTPEAGALSATATVPNACAGTIYRTGVLA